MIYGRTTLMVLVGLLVAAPAAWSRPHDEVQAPRGQEVQAPRGDEIQASRSDNGHEFPTLRR